MVLSRSGRTVVPSIRICLLSSGISPFLEEYAFGGSSMVGEFQTANICLYATYLQPRTINPSIRKSNAAPMDTRPDQEVPSTFALDVFDKTVRRTECLLAYLQGNGYDITNVADNLRQLKALRGDLTRAFATPSGYDLRRHLQNVFEVRVVELCSAIRSLKDSEHTGPRGQCPGYFTGKDTAFPLWAGDFLPGKCDGA